MQILCFVHSRTIFRRGNRGARRNILSECQFVRYKLCVKWCKIETRYSALGSRRLTAWYVHDTTNITNFRTYTSAQERNKHYVQNHFQGPEIASFKATRKVKSLEYKTPNWKVFFFCVFGSVHHVFSDDKFRTYE